MKVFLDDIRPCPRGFVWVKSVEECLVLLRQGKVDILSLDHDLGEGKPTGYDLVKIMVEENLYPKEIYIHTANPVGRENMYKTLARYKPPSVKVYNHPYPTKIPKGSGSND